jgi:hypothetical protein
MDEPEGREPDTPQWTPDMLPARVQRLKNPREEAFCRAYVSGDSMGNATAAFAVSHPHCKRDSARSKAPLLLAKDSIKQRIAQLQDDASYVADADRDFVKRRLREESEHASQSKDRIKALEKIAVMNGDFVEKTETKFKTDEEFVKFISKAYEGTMGALAVPLPAKSPFAPVKTKE